MLAAITSGDRSALANIYTSYYGRLAHFLSQFTGSDIRVGEIINDTFITVWQWARAFPFESKVSAWIFRIAHRHASRVERCYAPRESAHFDKEVEGRQLREPDTQSKTHRPVLSALQRLPTEQRVVLTLCYRMGYSIEEIAFITDSQVETVELRMLQARGQLQRHLRTLDRELRF